MMSRLFLWSNLKIFPINYLSFSTNTTITTKHKAHPPSSKMSKLPAQSPTEIFMMKPANFLFNEETSVTNHFQDGHCQSSGQNWRLLALEEFRAAVETLRAHQIRVTVFQDSDDPVKPDAIFPNNWISCHETGEVVLYPMAAVNRRLERREDVVDWLRQNFTVSRVIDLSQYEEEGKYLEGTGSMVLDYVGEC